VKYRLVWFREEHAGWTIETEFVSITDKSALAKATIRDESGRIVSTSHKYENERGFPDFLEKAETGAIGRALALIGYGTQFCADELDEGSRIVDAPANVPKVTSTRSSYGPPPSQQPDPFELPMGLSRDLSTARAEESEGEPEWNSSVDPGDFQVPFGRKYKGKKVREIPRHEIESYLAWLEADSAKKRTPVGFEVKLLKKAVELHYSAAPEAAESA
jgi:hypothetical protein